MRYTGHTHDRGIRGGIRVWMCMWYTHVDVYVVCAYADTTTRY